MTTTYIPQTYPLFVACLFKEANLDSGVRCWRYPNPEDLDVYRVIAWDLSEPMPLPVTTAGDMDGWDYLIFDTEAEARRAAAAYKPVLGAFWDAHDNCTTAGCVAVEDDPAAVFRQFSVMAKATWEPADAGV